MKLKFTLHGRHIEPGTRIDLWNRVYVWKQIQTVNKFGYPEHLLHFHLDPPRQLAESRDQGWRLYRLKKL